MLRRKLMVLLTAGMSLAGILGCSLVDRLGSDPTVASGQPVAGAPTRTPWPTFTPQADMTPTLLPTSTSTVTPTPIPTNTPVPTNTPAPTDTIVPTDTSVPATPVPADTPTPAPPTETPTPQYAVNWKITNWPPYDTGSDIQTRITAAIVKELDASYGSVTGWIGAQFMVVDPNGMEHLSDPIAVKQLILSTPGGDGHLYNVEMKIQPYIAGHYKAWVVINGKQESPVVEFDMAASPCQYVHLDFYPPS